MTVLLIIVVALIALVLFLYFYRRRGKATGYTPYIDAMVALLEHNDAQAMKKFKEAVRLDSDLIDAYIRLGDLYRKQGDTERALQIHQSLTIRPTLKKEIEKRIYYALVNDLLDMGRHNKAVSFLEEILKIDKKDQHARELILRIHEDMGNYGDCITHYESGGFRRKDEKRHAFYYAALAQKKLKDAEENDAEIEKEVLNLLKKALKIYPDSLTALCVQARFYEQKNDLKKAKEGYYRIVTKHPDQAFLVLPSFEKVYFELDLFDDIIPIYEKIFGDNPRNFAIGFALADLYEKKNDRSTATSVYNKLMDLAPDNVIPKLRLLKLTIEDNKLAERITAIEESMSGTIYHCSACGCEKNKFEFLCPQCYTVESFVQYS